MKVAIAGGHGKIALALTRRLAERGDAVTSLIRNPAHADEVRAAGATPAVCDLEHASVAELTPALEGADAAVFAAGAGPGSGAERKLTMDRDGAIKFLAAANAAAVQRFVIVSSVGAENPPGGDDVFSVYLRAKAEADAAVMQSDREWTVVRPGPLSDDAGTGQVRISTDPFRGRVAREDVAGVLDAILRGSRAATGKVLYVGGGEDAIEDALAGA
jgi:nucleoside-diphosphate-sugar epimerase